MSKFPNPLSNFVDLNSPLNGVPHWMTETLDGLALMKVASKCSETLQEYRSGDGKNNPDARISKIPLNCCRSEISTEWCTPLDG